MKIPNTLHFIWIGSGVQPWVRRNLFRWQMLNPGWTVKLHTEEVVDNYYADLYAELVRLKSVQDGPDAVDLCSLSDIMRLSILRQEGGWYFDCDFVPISPMSELEKRYRLGTNCFLTKQFGEGPKRIANGVIGLSKKAKAWKDLDRIVNEHAAGEIQRTSFGPLLMTRLAIECPDVTIGDTDDFYKIRFNPRGIALDAYRKLLANDFHAKTISDVFGGSNPVAMHLWMGRESYDIPDLNREASPLSVVTRQEPPCDIKAEAAAPAPLSGKLVVACVLRTGGEYDADYVHKLMRGCQRFLTMEHDFICLTDSTEDLQCRKAELKHWWPGWWSKVELFRDDIFREYERVIYFDLDTVIVDVVDELAKSPCDFAMLHGIRRLERRASGIMVWQGDHSEIYKQMVRHESEVLDKPNAWDQEFIAASARRHYGEMGIVQDMMEGIISYKKDVQPIGKLPDGARVVCFHGSPRPRDVRDKWGWMKEHWK